MPVNIEHLADENNDMYVRILKDDKELLPITRVTDITTTWDVEKCSLPTSNNL